MKDTITDALWSLVGILLVLAIFVGPIVLVGQGSTSHGSSMNEREAAQWDAENEALISMSDLP